MAEIPETIETPRLLGPWPAAAVVAGTMLGVGIYIGPPEVAAQVDSVAVFLFLWLGGGLAALCGALSVAELSAMVPQNGGHYVYMKRAYSPGVGFRPAGSARGASARSLRAARPSRWFLRRAPAPRSWRRTAAVPRRYAATWTVSFFPLGARSSR
jgi:amino acid transporter